MVSRVNLYGWVVKLGFCIVFGLLPAVGVAQTLPLRLVTTMPANLPENSGLVVTGPNRLWSHNDGGSPAELYEFDTTGTVLRTLVVVGAGNVDWEDLTRDDAGNFYVGDFGNNLNDRTDLVIYKLPPPDSITGDSIVPGRIAFSYADQLAFPPHDSLKNFDMEAFVAFGDSLYLFSKNRTNPFDGYTKLYRLPQDTGTWVAELVDSFYTGPGPSTAYWISGAALSPGGDQLMLISYPRCWLFSCYPGADFFGGADVMRTYPLSQMEAVAWKDSTHLYLSDELINGAFGGKLYEADMRLFVQMPDADLGPDTVFVGDTLVLNAPPNAGGSYLWSTGATTSSISITQSGQYWLQVTAANGCFASDTIDVTLLTAIPFAFPGGPSLLGQPNPFSTTVTLRLELEEPGTLEWQLMDVWGRLLDRRPPMPVARGPWQQAIGETLPGGIYYFTLIHNGQLHSIRLVKQ